MSPLLPEKTIKLARIRSRFHGIQVLSMSLIRDLVQQAIATSYLTIEAEEQLRRLLQTKYEAEDLKAFMKLQLAVMEGLVRQESRLAFQETDEQRQHTDTQVLLS